ncbi:kinetochore protein SPC25 homolog isoform X1 [Phragmites australis]|uniref:kinetochore protein SPC25 homolog isoform X1 n=1 Tax=Phragmites australis TaxID=29695 RepID=UPI002D78D51F|nr:kinetochore protein SPC25 homolog isoform X1 [Phragmites australis]
MEPSTIAATAGDVGERGAPDLRRRMAAQRAALVQRMAAGRDASASAAFGAALGSARSVAERALLRQEELRGLKIQSRELESQLAQALSVKLRKESKLKLTEGSFSSATAINEQLKNSLIDQRNKRDQYAAVISDQLQALEAKSTEDATWQENIEEAVLWYDKFLGFKVVGGKGVKFVFNKIDSQNLVKEYSFCINLDKDRYNLLQCDPHVKDIEELVKDLNLNDDLFKFVRTAREKFQTSTVNGSLPVSPVVCADVSPVPFSSPVTMSVDAGSKDVPNQSHSQSKNKRQSLPAKRSATALSAASPAAAGSSLRRSPRFVGMWSAVR